MKTTFTFLFVLWAFLSSAQTLLPGYTWDGTSMLYIHCDRVTGLATVIDTIPAINSVQTESAFLTSNGARYTLIGTEPNNDMRMITLDAATGSVIASPLLTGFLNAPLHNCANDTVYAIRMHPVTGVPYFVFVEPASAMSLAVDSLQEVAGIFSTTSTIDPVNRHYIFLGTDTSASAMQRLYSVNLWYGNVVTSPAVPQTLYGIRYHCADSTLYAVWQDSLSAWHVVSVDPQTGAVAVAGSLPGLSGIALSDFTIDQQNAHYIFKGVDALSNTHLYTFDLAGGTLLYSPLNDPMAQGFQLSSCCSEVTTVPETHNPPVRLYPNPASDALTLEWAGNGGMIRIYNSLGQEVLQLKAAGSRTSIDVRSLPAGLYHVAAEGEQRVSAKFLKQ